MVPGQSVRTIKAFPDINLRALFRRNLDGSLLKDDRFHLYASGRAAAYAGAKVLMNSATKTVHMPSYHCGVEVEAFLRAGFAVRFYPVGQRLSIDVDLLAKESWHPGDVVFVTHYFGFSQPIEDLVSFCGARGLILAEDCAHSLYTTVGTQHLGRFGDICVFSLRKTIALPNGGGLLISNPRFASPNPPRRHWVPSLIKGASRSVLEYEDRRGGLCGRTARVILDLYRKASPAPEDRGFQVSRNTTAFYDDPRYDYDLALSLLSRYLLQPMPVSDIRAFRRRNYHLLSERLASRTDLQAVFPSLRDGTVPLCYPVWVDSSDRWTRHLSEKGVESFVFGRFPHPLLPSELSERGERIRSGILGLPVHQDLTENEIHELADRVCHVYCGG